LFTPDGNRLVTADGSLNNNVRVWDLSTGQTIRSFGNLVQELAFVAGGQLVTAGSDLAVQVWDIDTGQVIRPLTGAAQIVVGLESSTNSPLVIAGCHNRQIITWDASTGDIRHDFMGESLGSIAAIPGTNQVLAGHLNSLVRVKNREIGDNLRVFGGHTTSTTTGVGFSPNGHYVVSGGTEVLTRQWNRTNALPHVVVPGHGAGTQAATFSPDGNYILTTFGAPIYSARLSNPQSGLVEREFFGHTSWLSAAVFSPDGQRIATCAQDGTARLWNVASGSLIRTFTTPGAWIRSVAVSSNNLLVASGSTDGIVRLWNAANGQLLRTFELNAGAVTSLAFSPATGELLVAWADGFLRTFDPATGELKLDTVAPAAFLEAAAYSPDGRFILGGEGWPFFTARLWDARDGRELRVFASHAAPVTSVAFSATGKSILTGSDVVRLWDISDIAARMEVERKGGDLELRWHTGTLQQANSANGPWFDATDAVSPRLVSPDRSPEFFRVRAAPED
jgi:WD40 repeat protein